MKRFEKNKISVNLFNVFEIKLMSLYSNWGKCWTNCKSCYRWCKAGESIEASGDPFGIWVKVLSKFFFGHILSSVEVESIENVGGIISLIGIFICIATSKSSGWIPFDLNATLFLCMISKSESAFDSHIHKVISLDVALQSLSFIWPLLVIPK